MPLILLVTPYFMILFPHWTYYLPIRNKTFWVFGMSVLLQSSILYGGSL
nr:MAG TPA: hypothetical protein [Caudoviricetes sp.]